MGGGPLPCIRPSIVQPPMLLLPLPPPQGL